MQFTANKWRTRELEIWIRNEAIKAKAQNEPKVARCWKQASGLNCTFESLVLMISHRIFTLLALLCVKFAWRSAVRIPVADRCVRVWTYIDQTRTKQQTAVTGWFECHWTAECSINVFFNELRHDFPLLSIRIVSSVAALGRSKLIGRLVCSGIEGIEPIASFAPIPQYIKPITFVVLDDCARFLFPVLSGAFLFVLSSSSSLWYDSVCFSEYYALWDPDQGRKRNLANPPHSQEWSISPASSPEI